jgi:hypothetical protein
MGVFPEWQPLYAEQGVVTFPVKDKKPCIKGWNKVGSRGSEQLARKFPEADAFAFQCGATNGITVVDVDDSDEAVLEEAVSIFGRSPVIWRTGSGNYAMPFRFNGELRKIRPIPALPIDLLGGGYAIAPPSAGSTNRYEFIKGSLDDFADLPFAQPLNDNVQKSPKLLSPIAGKRNDDLFNFALEQARFVDDFDTLLDVVATENADLIDPLPQMEVVKLTASAWGYETRGENLKGRGGSILIGHDLYDQLSAERNDDAFMLCARLKRHHWGRKFILAKAMAPAMGWGLPRFYRARKTLVALGIIECIHRGGRGPSDPPVYRWGKGCTSTPQ